MPRLPQPKVEHPDEMWVTTNFAALSGECWVFHEPIVGYNLVVLAPAFGSAPINLGVVTNSKRRVGSRSFDVWTDKTSSLVTERYTLFLKVHVIDGVELPGTARVERFPRVHSMRRRRESILD